MLSVGFGIGYVPHKPDTNLVGSCSAAMSAACQPLPSEQTEGDYMTKDDDLASKKLQWGVVRVWTVDVLGHCSFSDGPVEKLQKGSWYAGL